jgi:hypothetical protein
MYKKIVDVQLGQPGTIAEKSIQFWVYTSGWYQKVENFFLKNEIKEVLANYWRGTKMGRIRTKQIYICGEFEGKTHNFSE